MGVPSTGISTASANPLLKALFPALEAPLTYGPGGVISHAPIAPAPAAPGGGGMTAMVPSTPYTAPGTAGGFGSATPRPGLLSPMPLLDPNAPPPAPALPQPLRPGTPKPTTLPTGFPAPQSPLTVLPTGTVSHQPVGGAEPSPKPGFSVASTGQLVPLVPDATPKPAATPAAPRPKPTAMPWAGGSTPNAENRQPGESSADYFARLKARQGPKPPGSKAAGGPTTPPPAAIPPPAPTPASKPKAAPKSTPPPAPEPIDEQGRTAAGRAGRSATPPMLSPAGEPAALGRPELGPGGGNASLERLLRRRRTDADR